MYRKIPVIVPPGYKPIKSETDFSSRLKAPPDISPYIFIIFFFHSFHFGVGFF